MTKIIVKQKKIYNQMRYYPLCDTSRLLCDIQRHANSTTPKSLGEWQLDVIRKAGWEIQFSV